MDKPNDSIGIKVLRNFVNGIQDKMEPSFGRVSSREEEHYVKRQIARELGVEEEYHPNYFIALSKEGKDGGDANCAVEERYDELCTKGKIQEDPTYANTDERIFDDLTRGHTGEDSGKD